MFTIGRKNLSTYSLLLVGVILLGSLGGSLISVVEAAGSITASLVRTIDTSQWNPPSPDPSGITYWPAHDTLMISDGEVDKLPVFQGVNVYEATRAGSLVKTHTTMPFSKEPVGIAIAVNPGNGHFFISDDNQKKVFEVDLGRDEKIGTGDDTVTSFSTSAFGSNDPEGIAFGQGNLYISDGAGQKVYIVKPGANGRFDGVAPAGDDQVTSFAVSSWLRDPEGIAFNADSSTLYIIDRRKALIETTTTGTLVNTIDISFLNAVNPADVTRAPASNNAGGMNLYIVDRGIDNSVDPNENDGKIYEIKLAGGTSSANLLKNSGFELDANNDGRPDNWKSDSRFTRSSTVVRSGSYAGRHSASDDSSYAIYQTVSNLTAGTTYTFSGWVNIPPTSDAFTFKLQVQWRNASNTTISTQTLKTYKASTSGWTQATASLVAPTGTASARVRMVASSLNATIYGDDFVFGP